MDELWLVKQGISLWFGMIFPPPFSQSDFDFRYLLGSKNLLRSCNMYVSPSVGLSVCLLAFQSVTLITSKDSRPWLWPHCYTIRTRALGLNSGVLVRGSRAAPAALNGLKFFRTQEVALACSGLTVFDGVNALGIWAFGLKLGPQTWDMGTEFGPEG